MLNILTAGTVLNAQGSVTFLDYRASKLLLPKMVRWAAQIYTRN